MRMRAIDADALIPMMKYATTDSEIGVFPIKIGFNDIEKVINEQPTIEPERKKGRWIQYGDEFCCSECGGWAYMDECDEGIKTHQSKFCPECGARMEENDEGD